MEGGLLVKDTSKYLTDALIALRFAHKASPVKSVRKNLNRAIMSTESAALEHRKWLEGQSQPESAAG